MAQNIYVQPSGKGLGFYTGEDGYLYVDNLRIDDIRAEVCSLALCSTPYLTLLLRVLNNALVASLKGTPHAEGL